MNNIERKLLSSLVFVAADDMCILSINSYCNKNNLFLTKINSTSNNNIKFLLDFVPSGSSKYVINTIISNYLQQYEIENEKLYQLSTSIKRCMLQTTKTLILY
jgi:hypothetical protein